MDLTIVYLVRHAHSHWQPSEERPLSERGRADAAVLARSFGSTAISAIYSSPARRAVETVQPLAEARAIGPVPVTDLRERELVVPPGMSFEAAVETAWRDRAVGRGGTEPNRLASARGVRVIRDIVAARRGETVVVSTHGNLLALMLNGLDPSYGYDTWRSLSFPDVYRLSFRGDAPVRIERTWTPPNARAPRGSESKQTDWGGTPT